MTDIWQERAILCAVCGRDMRIPRLDPDDWRRQSYVCSADCARRYGVARPPRTGYPLRVGYGLGPPPRNLERRTPNADNHQ